MATACVLLLITSCGNGTEDIIDAPVTNEKHFTCDVDNVSFSANGFGVYALKDHDGPETTRVFGTRDPGDTNEKLFAIRIDDSLELNTTHHLNKDNFWVSLNDGENQYSSLPVVNGEGTITITKRTADEIAGTFACQLGNISGSGEQLTVTNGAFDVKYQ